MNRLRLGLVQMTAGIDPAVNTATLTAAITALAADGAQIAFTPEMSGLLDRNRDRLFATVRREADDPVLAAVRAAARAHHIWVHLGSLALAEGRDGRLVNRGFLIDDQGDIRARYDKLHLFDVDVGAGHSYRESASFTAGEQAVATMTPWGAIGLSICYDLRFARLYDALTSEGGAMLLSVPAAFTKPTGEAHWHVLLRARAIEAGVFVAAAAQTGLHEDGRETYGHSLVIDPWGQVLLDMGTEPGHAVCDIDLDAVAATRARIPAIDHRRAVTLGDAS